MSGRLLAAMAAGVVIVFGLAFAIGSMSKKHSAAPPAVGQLAQPAQSTAKQVSITALGAAGTIPGLKPKPQPPKPKPTPATSTPAQSTPSSVASSPTVTSSAPPPVVHTSPPVSAPPSGGNGSSGGSGSSSSGSSGSSGSGSSGGSSGG